jgi:pilus assembly protein Flp/PilA
VPVETTVKSFLAKTRRFLTSDDGPTVVEYAVMLALIVCVSVTAVSTLGTCSSRTFHNVGQSLGR